MLAYRRLRSYRWLFSLNRRGPTITAYRKCANAKVKTISAHYQTLGVSPNCEQAELKEAFLSLAKKYHPDSGLESSDPEKFTLVEQAYRQIVEERKNEEKLSAEEAEEEERLIFDIRHTAPQHRQFLNYEGIGFGTPAQRQRQYERYKVSRASQNVYEYKQEKVAGHTETAMVVKDKRAAKKIKTRYGMDRLVEDLIQESMMKGDFDNLSGKGKPLTLKDSPHLDVTDYNLNRIIIDSGHAPEWITLQGEIRRDLKKMRNELLRMRTALGPEPYETAAQRDRWSAQVTKLRDQLDDLNKSVLKLNLIVPAMHMQMVPYTLQRELNRSLKDYLEKKEKGELPVLPQRRPTFVYEPVPNTFSEPYGWRKVLRDILQVFV